VDFDKLGGSGESGKGIWSPYRQSPEVGLVRKVHVIALMAALIYVTTWVLAAPHVQSGSAAANPTSVVGIR